MKFLHPVFLFALFAVIIPILIHLFSFRRFTTVYFSNVNYLKNIRKESRKKSRLKNLLILLSRILAISSLVFVFAQPYLPSENRTAARTNGTVAVYIDNSFSMNALSTRGQLLEFSRNKAIEIAGAYPPDTRFMLITNDLMPQHQHIFNREQFIRQVSEIGSSPKSLNLSRISDRLTLNAEQIGTGADMTAYFISDFQSGTTDLEDFKEDSGRVNYFLPVTPEITANLYIDSCWMEFPAHKLGQEERLQVKVINRSKEVYQNLPVKFYLNDTLKALGNFNIEAGGEQVVELKYMNINSGIHSGYAEISDYPYVHDNSYYLNYTVQPSLKALAIYDSGPETRSGMPYLRALFSGDDYVIFEEASSENLQVSRLGSYNTIFLVNMKSLSSGIIGELKKAAENGATVVFFPETDGKTESYNNFLGILNANRITGIDTARQNISGIEWRHPVYDQVFRNITEDADLPRIYGSFIFSEDTRIPETKLLWFRNKAKAVAIQPAGDGNLIVFSFPLSPENDEFARHILFVPTLYSLVINSLPRQKIAYTIGRESQATLSRQNIAEVSSITIKTPAEQEFIPEYSVSEGNRLKIMLNDFFSIAGHYRVTAGGTVADAISMNYDRKESDPACLSPGEIIAAIDRYHLKNTMVIEEGDRQFSEILSEIYDGMKLWKWFLAFALLFLTAEALIVRFWK